MNDATAIIGGGLAGCECARTLASRGRGVVLFEARPGVRSAAHATDLLSELVCSNSLRSDEETSGIGLLKRELRDLGSPFMADADATRVPAGKALAVDRTLFAERVTAAVEADPDIELRREEISSLDDPRLDGFGHVVLAAGPLASEPLSRSLAEAVGMEHCYFYDAIAPIVWGHSLDMDVVFRGSRYGTPPEDGGAGGDYLNCPMTREEYEAFHAALVAAEKTRGRDFEKERHFEGCMPIEALAERGPKTLAFGPLKPVGFVDPRTGTRPWAVLQLRAETRNGEAFNLVGCQTKLAYGEQARVFRLVPGLGRAEFVRFGSMHRNTYVDSPKVLAPDGSLKARPRVFPAGQITGVEGYVESAAHGRWIGLALAARLEGRTLPPPPPTTALGALLAHLAAAPACRGGFQPSNAHFGLMPELEERTGKRERRERYAARARRDFAAWLASENPA